MRKEVKDFKVGVIEIPQTQEDSEVIQAATNALGEQGGDILPVLVKSGFSIHFVHVKNGQFTVSRNRQLTFSKFDGGTFTSSLRFNHTRNFDEAISKYLKKTFSPENHYHGVTTFNDQMDQLFKAQKFRYSIQFIDAEQVSGDEFQRIQNESIKKQLPLMFKRMDSTSILGYSGNGKWEVKKLDNSKLTEMKFGSSLQVLENTQIPQRVFDEIEAKGAHLTTSKQLSDCVILDSKIIDEMLPKGPDKEVIRKNLSDGKIMVAHSKIGLKPSLLDEHSFFVSQGSRQTLLNIYAYLMLVNAGRIKNNTVLYGVGREIAGIPALGITDIFYKHHMRPIKEKKEILTTAQDIRDERRNVGTSTYIIGTHQQQASLLEEVERKNGRLSQGSHSHFEKTYEFAARAACKQGGTADYIVFISDNKYSFIAVPKDAKPDDPDKGHFMYSIWGNGKRHFIHHLEGTLKNQTEKEELLKDYLPIMDGQTLLGYFKLRLPTDDAMMELAVSMLGTK